MLAWRVQLFEVFIRKEHLCLVVHGAEGRCEEHHEALQHDRIPCCHALLQKCCCKRGACSQQHRRPIGAQCRPACACGAMSGRCQTSTGILYVVIRGQIQTCFDPDSTERPLALSADLYRCQQHQSVTRPGFILRDWVNMGNIHMLQQQDGAGSAAHSALHSGHGGRYCWRYMQRKGECMPRLQYIYIPYCHRKGRADGSAYSPESGDKLRLELLQQELLRQQRVLGVAKPDKHSLQQLHSKRPQCFHLYQYHMTSFICRRKVLRLGFSFKVLQCFTRPSQKVCIVSDQSM